MRSKLLTKLACLILLVMMCSCLFIACSQPKPTTNNKTEVVVVPINATNVSYASDGKYQTTLDISGKGLTANDITIGYSVFNSTGYQEAIKSNPNANRLDYIENKKATIDAIKDVDGKMVIDFTDSAAGANRTEEYSVLVGKNKVASVDVDFQEIEMVPSINSVRYDENAIRISFELKKGKFNGKVLKDMVLLGESFADLEVASISNSEKNLTMQLTGTIKKHEGAGIYNDGTILVAREAFVGSQYAVQTTIDVITPMMALDPSRLNYYDAGMVSVPLMVKGVMDIGTISKEDIVTSAGITVTGIDRGIDEIMLLLNVEGATDINSAARIIDGTDITIGDYTIKAALTPAEFYPVFDFVRKVGDKFEMGIMLYASYGVYDGAIASEDVVLTDGFSGATINSVKLLSDTVAELNILVDAGGKAIKDINIDGGITLKKGVLANAWGDPSEEVSYKRNYADNNKGKALDDKDIESIKKIVGGFGNTAFGTVSAIASGATSAYSGIKSVLQIAGFLNDDKTEVSNLIIKAKNEITDILNKQTVMLQQIQLSLEKLSMADFLKDLNKLIYNVRTMDEYYISAAKLGNIQVPATDASDSVWNDFNEQVMVIINREIAAGNTKYTQFHNTFKNVDDLFDSVASGVNGMDTLFDDAITRYDNICSKVYNMDTLAYNARMIMNSNINYALTSALSHILTYRKASTKDDCVMQREAYDKAYKKVSKHITEISKPGKQKVHLYYKNMDVFNEGYGGMTSDEAVVRMEYFGPYGWRTSYGGTNFSDDEIKDFERRLQGNYSMTSEMKNAGFKDMDNYDAVAFKSYQTKGSFMFHESRKSHRYNSHIIRMGTKSVEWGALEYDEYDRKTLIKMFRWKKA